MTARAERTVMVIGCLCAWFLLGGIAGWLVRGAQLGK